MVGIEQVHLVFAGHQPAPTVDNVRIDGQNPFPNHAVILARQRWVALDIWPDTRQR